MKTIVQLVEEQKEYFLEKDTAAKQAVEANIAPVEADASSASRAYVVGEQLFLNDVLYDVISPISVEDAIVVNTNITAANKLSADIQTLTNQVTDISEVMGKNGAKNKEPFDIDVVKALNTTGTWTGNSYALNGITFAFADDGKVTVSGTASALCSINISGNYDLNGDYIITGCPSGGGGSTYSLRIYDSSATVVADDIGEGISFTANNLANCRTNIIVRKDAAISTPIVFAPMIRDSKDPDATYQPYAKTNQELTAENQTLENRVDDIEDNYQSVKLYHNIPRLVPKDVTSYITDGTFYKRLAGTDGFELFEDLYVGDYIQMSRAISAYEQTQTYQATGSQYVTIAGLDTRMCDGDGGDSVSVIDYHHAVMVPGQGFGGIQHFGRSRMNSSKDTAGGYVGSEMFITTIGAVATSGSTATEASINQQLYAEFGSHLKTIRQMLSNAMDSTRYNRFGQASGASSGWAWTTVQAVIMSEVEVYGSIVWSSSGYDTGNGNIQLPLFQHNKQAMNNRSGYYWLKDVASSAIFCNCGDNGDSSCDNASDAGGFVRPRFILA